jgi:hypothetical protein
MIIVNLQGRLGNQLFQYAFALSTAKVKHTLFLLDPKEPNVITKYFSLELRTQFLFSKIGHILNRYLLNSYKNYNKIEQKEWADDVEIMNNSHYSGFFQSENFFKNYKEDVRKKLTIKNKYYNAFFKKYGNLFSNNKILVLHIRRTDYANFGGKELGGYNMCLPMTFYDNCLNKVHNIDDFKIICISDDIDFVKEYYKDRNYMFENNDMIIDFQLIKYADVAIIANSSFAWWASYLNNKPNKTVYVPKYWLGFKVNTEYPVNIISEIFTQVDIN